MLVSLSLSQILFHYTKLPNLLKILKNNSFELKPVDGTSTEEGISTGYYFSTTRHRLGGYHLGKDKLGACLIELDGSKIGSNYKGKAVDYWQDYAIENHRATFQEGEDRVLSKKPTIPNALKYIRKIDILFPDGVTRNERDAVYVRHVISFCKKNGIGIFIYTDHKSFLSADTSKARPLRDFYIEAALGIKRKPMRYNYQNTKEIDPYIELYYKNDWSELSKKAKGLVSEYFRYGLSSVRDVLGLIQDDMQGAKTAKRDEFKSERKKLDTMVKFLTKERWTVKQYAESMAVKWEDIYKKL